MLKKAVKSCYYTRERKYLPFIRRGLVVRWCGKTAGMLVAFQGFTAPHGDKKTGADVANVCVLGYKIHLVFC
jgi:hypothetical protein